VTNAYRCGHCTRRARVRQAVRCARHAQGRRRSIGASSATASGGSHVLALPDACLGRGRVARSEL